MEINKYLVKLIQSIKDMESLNLFMGGAQLSKTEFRLLQEIVMEEEKGNKIISSELARRLGITRSAISQIVTKLEEKNIVRRVGSDTDKKIAYIELSEYTMEIFEKQCREANAIMERVVAEFGEEKLQKLFKANDEFAAVLNKVKEDIRKETVK